MPDSEVEMDIAAAPVDVILSEFEVKKDLLQLLCTKTKALIEESLADAKIRYQSIQGRVKRKEKLRDKYINPEKSYKKLDDITDLAGLRVITYYEDEVDHVADAVKREFDIDPRSVDKRESDSDRFGYRAVNYICRHTSTRTDSVEYKKFSGLCFEIQITSILNHAWAEMEHEWYDLRDAYPHQIKRRLARMAALLEVAESEFLAMRKEKSDHHKSISIAVAAKVQEVQLDSSSLNSFLDGNEVVERIDKRIADVLGRRMSETRGVGAIITEAEIAQEANIKTIEHLRTLLSKYEEAIVEFVALSRRCMPRTETLLLAPGVCVFHLAITLIGGMGDQPYVIQILRNRIKQPGVDIEGLAEAASIIAHKYDIQPVL
jgi:putative GTP pyrophosphokinase